MGLLDKIKPHVPKVTPTDVAISPDGGVMARWDDDTESRFPPRWLRARCPCAGCVDEWSGQRTLDVSKLPRDLRPVTIDEVGRYAVQIEWSDGHATGIYSWEFLRKLASETPVTTPGGP